MQTVSKGTEALPASGVEVDALRAAAEKARVDVVCAIAFLARDLGTERERATVGGVIESLCKTDSALRAALASDSSLTPTKPWDGQDTAPWDKISKVTGKPITK